jgi:allantoate deiminase
MIDLDSGSGAHLVARCDELARLSEDESGITRPFLTASHRASIELVDAWMRAAGMTTRLDACGTLIGRYEGDGRDPRAVLIGSHLDTVRNAGRYDGMLGVVAAIDCVERLHRTGHRLAFPVEVVAFGDEEGLRFGVALIGSRAMAGTLPAEWLDRSDALGTTLARALTDFGLDPARLGEARREPAEVRAWLEVHIEQGPLLETTDRALGTVTAICGASRAEVTFRGVSGHAGTVPMAMRHDAIPAAAEFAVAVEAAARNAGIVATVGTISARPGAVNVIAHTATVSLDVRAAHDAVREAVVAELRRTALRIADRRGLDCDFRVYYETPATLCDPALIAACDRVLARRGFAPMHLTSGAGHDGIALGAVMPIAMIFVRCAGGISHHPAESVTAADAGESAAALLDLLRELSEAVGD